MSTTIPPNPPKPQAKNADFSTLPKPQPQKDCPSYRDLARENWRLARENRELKFWFDLLRQVCPEAVRKVPTSVYTDPIKGSL